MAAELNGEVIVGAFNTDRDQTRQSIRKLAKTGAQIAGFDTAKSS